MQKQFVQIFQVQENLEQMLNLLFSNLSAQSKEADFFIHMIFELFQRIIASFILVKLLNLFLKYHES